MTFLNLIRSHLENLNRKSSRESNIKRIVICLVASEGEVRVALDILEDSTGMDSRQLYRALERCVVASKEMNVSPQYVANLFRELLASIVDGAK